MAKKEIIWSKRAEIELKKTLEFYNERNGSNVYSLKLLSEIEKIMFTLSENDLIGRLTKNKKTRVVVNGVYLIFYEIQKERIEILSFWNNKQNPKKRLKI